MLKRLHPKILALLLLSIAGLVFFLYSVQQISRKYNASISSLNKIQSVAKNLGKINALIARENSAAKKWLLTHDQAWRDEILELRKDMEGLMAETINNLPGASPLKQPLDNLAALLEKEYKAQDSALATGPAGITGDEVNAEDSIHAVTALMTQMQHDELYNRRQAFAADIRSNITKTLIGGVVVFVAILIVLIKFNNDNRLLRIAKQQASESERKYKSLVENVGPVVYTADLDGYITFASKKAELLTGYTHDELIGMHITRFIDPGIVDEVLKNYADQMRNRIHETVLYLSLVTKQGKIKPIGQSAILLMEDGVMTGFQCTVWDIDEVSQIEQDLRESERNLRKNTFLLQSILDNTNSLIYVKDVEGRYQIVNRRFKEIMGVTDDILNQTAYAFAKKDIADYYREMDETVMKTQQPHEAEVEVDTPHGRINLLLGKFPLLDENNETFGICGIATEITDRVNYQHELIEARSAAENAKHFQEQFLANMSHEIRTPMNGIQGMTNLLLESELNSQQYEFASFIKRCVNNLLVLINDILDFSKIQAGKLSLEHIPFEIRSVVKNVRQDFSYAAQEKGLRLTATVADDVPEMLVGDPYRLTQILINFIGNAVKFTHQGSVELSVSTKERKDNQFILEFLIADTGIGIAPENQTAIFESFNQANVSTTRVYGGTGLGLAICKQLVRMQHGEVRVESELGKGSRFYVQLPYSYTDKASTAKTQVIQKNDYSLQLAGKRVLSAEDNEVNQRLLVHVLKNVNIEPDLASNGQEAVDLLKKNKYDLVLMDVQMPLMDGYAATRYIREEMHSDVPILAMTATALKGELEKCLEAGMNDYLSKPFSFDDLYDKIVKMTSSSPAAQPEKTAVQQTAGQPLYDLSFLEDLGDRSNTIEMINLVLSNTNEQFSRIQEGLKKNLWEQVGQNAHKAKSSVGMLQVNELMALLVEIEHGAKDETKRAGLHETYRRASDLFKKLETGLKNDRQRLAAEIAAGQS